MDIYTTALMDALSPQVMFALIGGLIGVLIKAEQERFSLYYTVMVSLGAILVSGAMAEFLARTRHIDSILSHIVIGIVIGMLSASLLHAFNRFTPKLADDIVNHVGDTTLDKLDALTGHTKKEQNKKED